MNPGKFLGFKPSITSTTKNIITEATLEMVGSGTTSTGTSITLPSGLQQNDLVFVASIRGGTEMPNIPSGYTEGQSGDVNGVQYQWSYKRMGSTPDSTVTGLTGTAHVAFAFRGVDPDTIFDVTTPTAVSGTIGMPDVPGISGSTTVSGCVIVGIGFLDDDAITPTASKGTLIAYANNTNTIMAAYLTQAMAGMIYSTPEFSGSGSDDWVACAFVLRRYIVYGSYKSAAIWSLEDVYKSKI